jgi:hypothetical protein
MPVQGGYFPKMMTDVGGLIVTYLAGAKLRLYNVSIPYTPLTALATYTAAEAAFPGYVAVTATPVGITIAPGGGVNVWLAQAFFATSGTATEVRLVSDRRCWYRPFGGWAV